MKNYVYDIKITNDYIEISGIVYNIPILLQIPLEKFYKVLKDFFEKNPDLLKGGKLNESIR